MFFIWIFILGLVQAAVSLHINFLVLLAIFAGLRKGPLGGLFIGSLIGLFAEILSSTVFGLNIVIYSILGLLAGIIKARIYYKENVLLEFLFSFFGMLFFYLVYFVFTRTIQTGIFFTIIFSSLISPILFRLLDQKVKIII